MALGILLDNADEVNVGETVADAIEHKPFSWQHGSLFDLLLYSKSRSTSRASRIFVHVVLYQPHPDGFAPEMSLDLVHPLPNPQSVQVGVIYRQTNSMSAGSNNQDLRRRLSYVATQSRFPCSLLVFRSKPICFKARSAERHLV